MQKQHTRQQAIDLIVPKLLKEYAALKGTIFSSSKFLIMCSSSVNNYNKEYGSLAYTYNNQDRQKELTHYLYFTYR